MPPQVGRAGEGPGPITTNANDGVQEVKSADVQKTSAQPQKEATQNEAPRKATPKEASNKKGEMAAQAAAQKSILDNKLNVIQGTSGNDNIHVSQASGLLGVIGLYEVDVNGSKQYMTKQQLEHSEIQSGRGNDKIVVDANVSANMKIDGGSGNDVIIGGRGDDDLKGGSGRDIILGRNGNDRISGGSGDDYLLGGKGNDFISGGKGRDFIQGGVGNDVLIGGSGGDLIKGGGGIDRVVDERKNGDIYIDKKK